MSPGCLGDTAMALLDRIPYLEKAERHRPWPRETVAAAGCHAAIERLAAGECTLLGLWADTEPAQVHMALLDGGVDIAVLTYVCEGGSYPSVGARHPPAIRLERAIKDLFGLDASDSPDPRPWLDLGAWDVAHPLGEREPSKPPAPYAFLAAEGEALHQIAVGPVHAGIIEP